MHLWQMHRGTVAPKLKQTFFFIKMASNICIYIYICVCVCVCVSKIPSCIYMCLYSECEMMFNIYIER